MNFGRKRRIAYFLAGSFCLLISGCMPPPQRMYSGPQLPQTEESTIRTEDGRLRITYVDEKWTMNFFLMAYVYGGAREVKVVPGKHNIRLIYRAFFEYIGDFWLVTCPGKTYIAKYDVENGVRMWIEDAETGKPVGGVEGSADEPKTRNVPCDQG